jgi:ADP-ribose pyrophosphatase YjhB (NUDIX family)
MRKPDLISEFEFRGHVNVEWYDVLSKDQIPDLPWHQVYIVGDYEGKVPIVIYPDSPDNLPGGKSEPGETLEQTMVREVEEETNMRVLSWEPLGYQVCTRTETSEVSYQFRAYAKLEKIGEFVNDPGGNIQGHKLIKLEKINEYINYGVVGDRLISSAKPYFAKS